MMKFIMLKKMMNGECTYATVIDSDLGHSIFLTTYDNYRTGNRNLATWFRPTVNDNLIIWLQIVFWSPLPFFQSTPTPSNIVRQGKVLLLGICNAFPNYLSRWRLTTWSTDTWFRLLREGHMMEDRQSTHIFCSDSSCFTDMYYYKTDRCTMYTSFV